MRLEDDVPVIEWRLGVDEGKCADAILGALDKEGACLIRKPTSSIDDGTHVGKLLGLMIAILYHMNARVMVSKKDGWTTYRIEIRENPMKAN